MFDPFNSPSIPGRRASLTPKAKDERRRRSLPTASRYDASHHNSNRIIVKPASAEVISSLIETLSAISSPAEHHFDVLPNIASSHSTPASPRPWQSGRHSSHESIHDLPQTMPPSAITPQSRLDERKHQRPYGVDTDYLLRPNRIATEFPLLEHYSSDVSLSGKIAEPKDLSNANREIYSIGNLSIKPQKRDLASNTISAGVDACSSLKGVRNIRSLKSSQGLGFRSSRDSPAESDEKVIRSKPNQEPKRERLIIGQTLPELPQETIAMVSDRTACHVTPPAPPHVYEKTKTHSIATSNKLWSDSEGNAEESTTVTGLSCMQTQGCIPARDSSKRHSLGTNSSHQKRSSLQSKECNSYESKRAPVVHPDDLQEALQKVADDPAGDVVSRRIKELREQKIQRDRDSLETKSDFLINPQISTPSRTSSPSPMARNKLNTGPSRVGKIHSGKNADQINLNEGIPSSEPPPAISQRIGQKKSSRVSSNISKDTASNEFPALPGEETSTISIRTPPKRSNSRLLKRLSQPTGATAIEQQKRMSSHLFSQFDRYSFHQSESLNAVDHAVSEYLYSPRLNQKIKHFETGRVISFSEVGDTKGSVVFCCVGMGLTRFLTAFYDELAATLKLRLITPDRPGVGGSEPRMDGLDTPLGWSDDVRSICEHLGITKFSIMAHSAGAIYALATALRMPQHIRCRVHLLAPWIPPSQMSATGAQKEPLPATTIPYSHRILRALPTPFLRAANSSFLSTTSASITTSLPRTPRRSSKRRSISWNEAPAAESRKPTADGLLDSPTSFHISRNRVNIETLEENISSNSSGSDEIAIDTEKGRGSNYDARLTEAIWEAATTGANPAVDLLVCLERRQPIGFRYVDITKPVVIHHGSKDTRVPLENVKWLGKTMRRCEVRVLEGESHGLMASAAVMGGVLMEMAKEWDDWNRIVKGRGVLDRRVTNAL